MNGRTLVLRGAGEMVQHGTRKDVEEVFYSAYKPGDKVASSIRGED